MSESAVYEDQDVQIFTHRNADKIAGADHTHAIASTDENANQEAIKILDLPAEKLRHIFAKAADVKAASFFLFHFGNGKDTNNTQTGFHMHRVSGPLLDHAGHVNLKQTWVPRPNPKLPDILKDWAQGKSGIVSLALSYGLRPEEANQHFVIAAPEYSSLREFAEKGTEAEWGAFKKQMRYFAETLPDGARVIIDERFRPTGFFNAQVIGGENLAQDAGWSKKPSRWFENPTPHREPVPYPE